MAISSEYHFHLLVQWPQQLFTVKFCPGSRIISPCCFFGLSSIFSHKIPLECRLKRIFWPLTCKRATSGMLHTSFASLFALHVNPVLLLRGFLARYDTALKIYLSGLENFDLVHSLFSDNEYSLLSTKWPFWAQNRDMEWCHSFSALNEAI